MIPKHIQEQIEKEAEAFAERTAERIYDVKEYWTTSDRINGFINGAESYASKLLQAEDLIEKMAKLLGRIRRCLEWEEFGDEAMAIKELLTEYNTYKSQTSDNEKENTD